MGIDGNVLRRKNKIFWKLYLVFPKDIFYGKRKPKIVIFYQISLGVAYFTEESFLDYKHFRFDIYLSSSIVLRIKNK